MQGQLKCSCKDRSQCQLDAALELSGDSGIVQQNCRTCGSGASIRLPIKEALELHDALHRHESPPKRPAASEETTHADPPVTAGSPGSM